MSWPKSKNPLRHIRTIRLTDAQAAQWDPVEVRKMLDTARCAVRDLEPCVRCGEPTAEGGACECDAASTRPEKKLTKAQKEMIMTVWNNPNYRHGPVGSYGHRCYERLVTRGLIEIRDGEHWFSDRAMAYMRRRLSQITNPPST